jgi:hypothetical protein
MAHPCRLLLTLMIAVSLILAPLGGALAMGGLSGGDHTTAADCPKTVVDRTGAGHTDPSEALPELAHDGAAAECCDPPCAQCGHCPVTSLPAEPATGTPAHMILPQSPFASLTDLHTAPSHRPPKAG